MGKKKINECLEIEGTQNLEIDDLIINVSKKGNKTESKEEKNTSDVKDDKTILDVNKNNHNINDKGDKSENLIDNEVNNLEVKDSLETECNLEIKDNSKIENNAEVKKSLKIKKNSKTEKKLEIKSDLEIKDEENDILEIDEVKVKKRHKWLIISIIVVLTMILSIYICIPRINLNGDVHKIISYKETYQEEGVKAKVLWKDITKKIKYENNVDNKIGNYQIVYYLDYKFFKIKKIRKIDVVDNVKPVIEVNTEKITACPGKKVEIPEYKAIDEYDGDLTEKVLVEENDDNILLKVNDLSGNDSVVKIDVEKKDTEKPEINLSGSKKIYLLLNDKYKEPGYKAIDNCDGDITSSVVVTGSVNTGRAGNYQIKYSVKDSNGNENSVTRDVTIYTNLFTNSGTIGNGEIYLTFDDGPNEGTTNKILDILKEENVKATFFVTCNGPDYLIKRIYNEGHTVALHTATHNYGLIYSSVENYLSDLEKVSNRVKNLTGLESKIIRFPGGSSNTVSRNYSKGIMGQLTSLVVSQGYHYFDWNVDSNDAGGASSSTQVYNNVVNNLSHSRPNMVLMHDIKYQTRDAIREIIRYGKNNGYVFKQITNDTYMIRHSVNN